MVKQSISFWNHQIVIKTYVKKANMERCWNNTVLYSRSSLIVIGGPKSTLGALHNICLKLILSFYLNKNMCNVLTSNCYNKGKKKNHYHCECHDFQMKGVCWNDVVGCFSSKVINNGLWLYLFGFFNFIIICMKKTLTKFTNSSSWYLQEVT